MTATSDWRIEDGPAIADPLTFDFTVTEIELQGLRSGLAVPSIICAITVRQHVIVEGIDTPMRDIDGRLVIGCASASHMAGDIALEGHRGCLSLLPFPSLLAQLRLDPEHMAMVFPALRPGTSGCFEIEFGTVYDELAEPNFWNVAQSPVVLFDEFRLRICS